jgi:hypothetical protein
MHVCCVLCRGPVGTPTAKATLFMYTDWTGDCWAAAAESALVTSGNHACQACDVMGCGLAAVTEY